MATACPEVRGIKTKIAKCVGKLDDLIAEQIRERAAADGTAEGCANYQFVRRQIVADRHRAHEELSWRGRQLQHQLAKEEAARQAAKVSA